MNTRIAALACGLGLVASAGGAAAQCTSPFCGGNPPPHLGQGLFGGLFARQPVPAFQAAPWYLYWPYQAHFMTPAPVPNGPAGGVSYGPPGYGPVANPYFPAAPQVMPAAVPAGQ